MSSVKNKLLVLVSPYFSPLLIYNNRVGLYARNLTKGVNVVFIVRVVCKEQSNHFHHPRRQRPKDRVN